MKEIFLTLEVEIGNNKKVLAINSHRLQSARKAVRLVEERLRFSETDDPSLPGSTLFASLHAGFTKKHRLNQFTQYMFNGQMSFLNILSIYARHSDRYIGHRS